MDQTFLQLSELVRMGWTMEISLLPQDPLLIVQRAAVCFSRPNNPLANFAPYDSNPPIHYDINLFAPETEFRRVIAAMHALALRWSSGTASDDSSDLLPS